MRTTIALAATVALVEGGCSATRAEPIAGASQAVVPVVYCIRDAQTDPGTVHFDGPDWILSSSEGADATSLDVSVLVYVQPAVTTSGTFTLDPDRVSQAVGYTMRERFQLISRARATLARGDFKRLEAYTAYQRTEFEIRDAACAELLGVGAAYKPIGVYFRLVNAYDVAGPNGGPQALEDGG